MYHTLKWAFPHLRMVFAPEGDAGGGTASTPSGGASPGGDGGGGGGSVPAAAPSADPGSTPSSSPSGTGAPTGGTDTSSEAANPWAALGLPDADDDFMAIPLPSASPTVGPPPTPAAPPSQPVQPAPQHAALAPQGEPTALGAPDTQMASPPGEARPQLSASEPGNIAAALEADQDSVIAHLAQTRFALSEADIADLQDDAAKAVPRLLARAFLESQKTTYRFLAQSVPGMIQRYNTVRQANDAAETQFFTAHKALGLDPNNAQHRAVATRMAMTYRQMNPQMPLAQLIADIGPMVAMALKVAPLAPGAQSAPTPQYRPVAPFTPALPGGGHSPAPAPQDEWAGLGRDYEE